MLLREGNTLTFFTDIDESCPFGIVEGPDWRYEVSHFFNYPNTR